MEEEEEEEEERRRRRRGERRRRRRRRRGERERERGVGGGGVARERERERAAAGGARADRGGYASGGPIPRCRRSPAKDQGYPPSRMAAAEVCCATTPISFLAGPLRGLGHSQSAAPAQAQCCRGSRSHRTSEGVRAAVRTVASRRRRESRKGKSMVADFQQAAGKALARRASAAPTHGNHLPGRRIGLGPRQPGGGGARGGRISQTRRPNTA